MCAFDELPVGSEDVGCSPSFSCIWLDQNNSDEIANKKPLASLMANSLGTVTLTDVYGLLQGEGETKTGSLASKPYGNFLRLEETCCSGHPTEAKVTVQGVLLSQHQKPHSKY